MENQYLFYLVNANPGLKVQLFFLLAILVHSFLKINPN